jgi:hypothetical protein
MGRAVEAPAEADLRDRQPRVLRAGQVGAAALQPAAAQIVAEGLVGAGEQLLDVARRDPSSSATRRSDRSGSGSRVSMVWHRRWRWAVGAPAPAPSTSAAAPPSTRQMARNSVRASSTGRSWSTVRSSSPSAVARSRPDRMWATPVAAFQPSDPQADRSDQPMVQGHARRADEHQPAAGLQPQGRGLAGGAVGDVAGRQLVGQVVGDQGRLAAQQHRQPHRRRLARSRPEIAWAPASTRANSMPRGEVRQTTEALAGSASDRPSIGRPSRLIASRQASARSARGMAVGAERPGLHGAH